MSSPAGCDTARQSDDRRRIAIEAVSGQVINLLETVDGGVLVDLCRFSCRR
jgi:hypothetical protein